MIRPVNRSGADAPESSTNAKGKGVLVALTKTSDAKEIQRMFYTY